MPEHEIEEIIEDTVSRADWYEIKSDEVVRIELDDGDWEDGEGAEGEEEESEEGEAEEDDEEDDVSEEGDATYELKMVLEGTTM